MLRYFTLFLLFLGISPLFAQNDTIRKYDGSDDIDLRLEDILSGTETDQEVDYTVFTDYLEDLRRRPLNLNSATRDQLAQLPALNDMLINNLFRYLSEFGDLTSVYELQAVDGFTEDVFKQIQPFVQVKEARGKDISTNTFHPGGPPIHEVREGMTYEITQRFTSILETQKGYTAPDTASNGELSTRYNGSQLRSYTRVRARYGQNVSFAITGEKDPGEQMLFNKNQYGYDFLSAHAYIGNYGALKALVIGDYNIQVGQGLVLSSGLGFGKGSSVITSVKMPARGIKPYASVNENQFFRGVATTLAYKYWQVTAFASRMKLDASGIQAGASNDTTAADTEEFTGFTLGGLHRTPAEYAKRQNLTETALGGRLEYKNKVLTIGTTHWAQLYDKNIILVNFNNIYSASGRLNQLSGFDFDWVHKNFNVFGEVARSLSGGMAGVAGVMASIHPKVDVSLHLRHFDSDFYSFRGYTFAEAPRSLNNEEGAYIGVQIRPNTKWVISSFFDRYRYEMPRFRAGFPTNGHEYLTQIDYTPKRGTLFYLRFRSDTKEYNGTIYEANQALQYVIPHHRDQLRFQFQTVVHRNLSFRTRAEASWYRREGENTTRGIVIYQDIVWKPVYKVKLTARYGIFSTEDYYSRIYTYENDMIGMFSVPGLYGTGSRAYLLLNFKPSKGWDIWVRLAQTRFFDTNYTDNVPDNAYYTPDTQGSGLEEIVGSHRTELKVQVRWVF